MRSSSPIAVLALALALAGAASAPAAPPADAPDPQIADGSLQRGLDAARRHWQAAHLDSYRYQVRVSCFCAPKAPVFVVRNGVPKQVPAGEKQLATVPRLFKVVQQAIDRGVAGLNVSYGRRGVPKSIAIDGSQRIADDEVGYAISRFTPLG